MIAPVVAATSQTLVTRLPGWEGGGTRVQTMPLALATSTAATRPTTCSCASSWISCGSRITGPSPHLTVARHTGLPGGLGQGTESLNRVLQAQCATRQGQGPGARLTRRPQRPETHRRRRATRPDFHACAASPHGTSGLTGESRGPRRAGGDLLAGDEAVVQPAQQGGRGDAELAGGGGHVEQFSFGCLAAGLVAGDLPVGA